MIMGFWSWKPADLINVYKTRRQIFYKVLQKFFKIFWKLRFSWFFSSKYKRFSEYLFSLKVVVLWSRTKLLERCNLVTLLYSSSGLAISQKLKAKIAIFYDFLVRPPQCTSKPFGVPLYEARPTKKKQKLRIFQILWCFDCIIIATSAWHYECFYDSQTFFMLSTICLA